MMKHRIPSLTLTISLILLGVFSLSAQDFDGAWKMQGSDNHLLLIQDGYFSWTETSNQDKFINTLGGVLEAQNGNMNIEIQFNANDRYMVGETYTLPYKLQGDRLEIRHPEGYTMNWDKIKVDDQGLAGVWRITGRKVDDNISEMNRSPRKTYKLLTPGHFQWIAMNTDTGEFFGTGGGSYTFKNGIYTEHIEFFSRDDSRVGVSLSFDGEVKDGDWHHSGKSSKGDPIYEIWSKETEY